MQKTKLQALRQSAKLSQAELANVSGVAVSTIQKIEIRVNDIMKTRTETVIKLAKALNITVEELVKDDKQ